jgi:hypothetical protein
LGVGLTNLSCKKENCWEASNKFSQILRRRPRSMLGCGAKERKKKTEEVVILWVVALCNDVVGYQHF